MPDLPKFQGHRKIGSFKAKKIEKKSFYLTQLDPIFFQNEKDEDYFTSASKFDQEIIKLK